MSNSKTRQALKAAAHKLKPIVYIGNSGVTAAVISEIERALSDHELIKIKIQTTDRELKKQIFTEICSLTQAEPVQLIGNIGILFKKNQNK